MMDRSNPRLSGSAAMSGNMDGGVGLAAIILWNSGHFDTKEIADVLHQKEDAVCRVLHAARDVKRMMDREAAHAER